ncbi:hypothetical protein Fmac_015215 [Flemingia macrophylla]|uniref:Protein kinase domain-containing protein n=1 Tax=Flemingia macrophylla TaxID=520843 RepID=A0ABD1MDY3_9FABA
MIWNITLNGSDLQQDFNAKLSDFGLARDGPTGDNTHVSTRVIGSQGYAAPEYVATVINSYSHPKVEPHQGKVNLKDEGSLVKLLQNPQELAKANLHDFQE